MHLPVWSIAPPTAPASAPQAIASGTLSVPPVAAVIAASHPMNTKVDAANEAIAAAWFLKNVVVVRTAFAVAW